MIEKAEAIILNSKKYRDTSKILTMYTKEFGKISIIAKGSRSKNSRFGGSLEPMNHISLVFYKYPNRELQYISQSSIINFFPKTHSDFSKMMIVMAIVEIVNNVVHSDEQNEDFFNLILDTIKSIESSEKNINNYLIYFELHLISIFGFHINLHFCDVCGIEFGENYSLPKNGFIIEKGCVVCQNCINKTTIPHFDMSLFIISFFQELFLSKPEVVEKISIQSDKFVNAFNLLHKYLMHHITGMRKLKSLEIFSKIK